MARNRQRAKDRKQKLHRENIPGSLDHASGEVEEVEAAIVAGAGGEPVEPAPDGVADEPAEVVAPASGKSKSKRKPKPARSAKPAEPQPEPVEELEPLDDVEPDEGEFVDDDDREVDADAATVEHGRLGKGAGDLAVTPDAHKPAGFRLTNFIRACWAELQRVDWPDRRQVGQATAVVLGFVVVAGAFLGLADVVAQRIVDFIL